MADEIPGTRSTIRTVIAATSLVSALIVIVIGFALLVTTIQRGTPTPEGMWLSLGVLGLGGGLLATGIALMIWETAERYNLPK
jgi:dipeptide/tripeptide permease